MFKTIITALYLIATFNLMAQYDDNAPKQLDRLAEKIKNSAGISIDFNIQMQELGKDDLLDSDKGKLLLKGNAYVLSFNGTTTYCDGKSQWIYLEDEQEVTIQELDEEEVTAASIFTQYQDGFKFRTLKESDNSAIIELIPTEKSSPYLRITLHINTLTQELNAFVIQSRNATLTEIKVNAWKEKDLTTTDFVFNSSLHPDVEVIDLR